MKRTAARAAAAVTHIDFDESGYCVVSMKEQ